MIRAAWIALLAISAGLGFLLHTELTTPHMGKMTPPQMQVARATNAMQTDRNASMVDQALARPLFSPNRRPPSPASPDAKRSDGPPRLTAIVLSPNGRQAIFAPQGGGRAIRLSEGDRLENEVVWSIARGSVTLDGPTGRRVLRTEFESHPQPAIDPNQLALPGMITNVLPSATVSGGQPPRAP